MSLQTDEAMETDDSTSNIIEVQKVDGNPSKIVVDAEKANGLSPTKESSAESESTVTKTEEVQEDIISSKGSSPQHQQANGANGVESTVEKIQESNGATVEKIQENSGVAASSEDAKEADALVKNISEPSLQTDDATPKAEDAPVMEGDLSKIVGDANNELKELSTKDHSQAGSDATVKNDSDDAIGQSDIVSKEFGVFRDGIQNNENTKMEKDLSSQQMPANGSEAIAKEIADANGVTPVTDVSTENVSDSPITIQDVVQNTEDAALNNGVDQTVVEDSSAKLNGSIPAISNETKSILDSKALDDESMVVGSGIPAVSDELKLLDVVEDKTANKPADEAMESDNSPTEKQVDEQMDTDEAALPTESAKTMEEAVSSDAIAQEIDEKPAAEPMEIGEPVALSDGANMIKNGEPAALSDGATAAKEVVPVNMMENGKKVYDVPSIVQPAQLVEKAMNAGNAEPHTAVSAEVKNATSASKLDANQRKLPLADACIQTDGMFRKGHRDRRISEPSGENLFEFFEPSAKRRCLGLIIPGFKTKKMNQMEKIVESEMEKTAETETEKAADIDMEKPVDAETEKAAAVNTEKAAEAEKKKADVVDIEKAAEVDIKKAVGANEKEEATEAAMEKAADVEMEKPAEVVLEKADEPDMVKVAGADEKENATNVDVEKLAEAGMEKAVKAVKEKAAEEKEEIIDVVKVPVETPEKVPPQVSPLVEGSKTDEKSAEVVAKPAHQSGVKITTQHPQSFNNRGLSSSGPERTRRLLEEKIRGDQKRREALKAKESEELEFEKVLDPLAKYVDKKTPQKEKPEVKKIPLPPLKINTGDSDDEDFEDFDSATSPEPSPARDRPTFFFKLGTNKPKPEKTNNSPNYPESSSTQKQERKRPAFYPVLESKRELQRRADQARKKKIARALAECEEVLDSPLSPDANQNQKAPVSGYFRVNRKTSVSKRDGATEKDTRMVQDTILGEEDDGRRFSGNKITLLNQALTELLSVPVKKIVLSKHHYLPEFRPTPEYIPQIIESNTGESQAEHVKMLCKLSQNAHWNPPNRNAPLPHDRGIDYWNWTPGQFISWVASFCHNRYILGNLLLANLSGKIIYSTEPDYDLLKNFGLNAQVSNMIFHNFLIMKDQCRIMGNTRLMRLPPDFF